MKTTIEYADQVSNPLKAILKGDESSKTGTFCEKPDKDGTCLNCWAEVLNLRFGNKLAFDKSNRDKIEWIYRDEEMMRLIRLNERKSKSEKFPGLPLVVFCCDTFDIFQPSISDKLRDKIFDAYDELTNLVLLIQTTYPAKMNHYFGRRYEDYLPEHFWIGMSAGNQEWLDRHIGYLFKLRASQYYIIFEPLLGEINLHKFLCRRYNPFDADAQLSANCDLQSIAKKLWVIIGGESVGARPCYEANILSVVSQCRAAGVPVLVKQLGSNFIQINGIRRKLKNRNGGDISEFPEYLRERNYPRIADGGIEVIPNPSISQVEEFFTV
jgi:protein gp37